MQTTDRDVLASDILLAMNDKDYGKIDDLTTEDVQLRFPPGQLFTGRRSVAEFFHEVERRLPETTIVGHHVHSGADFAVIEYEIKGRTPSDANHEAIGCFVIEFDGNRVKSGTLYVDTAAWRELGRG